MISVSETYCAIWVLEKSSGLLVSADFLHADLLQRGACGIPLLTGYQRARLLLVQEHLGVKENDLTATHAGNTGVREATESESALWPDRWVWTAATAPASRHSRAAGVMEDSMVTLRRGPSQDVSEIVIPLNVKINDK